MASGGLDHKIRLWDLEGHGERLQIDVGDSEASAKGSIYALNVRGTVMASGGPDGIVRLWDARSGKRVTSFVGHTDNVRDILINQAADTIMTASSDQSIKVWSMTAGRCMYTLTMHNDSVWSLYSDHPQLSLFYSSDRSGLVARTDVRGREEMDDGLSIAVAQEHEGVNKLAVAGNHLWTATSSSSINRWGDVNIQEEVQSVEIVRKERHSSVASRTKGPSIPSQDSLLINGSSSLKIPLRCVLKISNNTPWIVGQRPWDSNTSTVNSAPSIRKLSDPGADTDLGITVPIQEFPEETIEGQNGLIKHVLLNDRRRVLTLDTAGDVILWDLLKCLPLKTFRKRHLEDVMLQVNTVEAVANWCGVDTRTGRLAVVLEENHCFDAEMYADEWDLENQQEFREDQRINLGKWVLRNLFAKLIEKEIACDATYRRQLAAKDARIPRLQREKAPSSIQLPILSLGDPQSVKDGDGASSITPKAAPNTHLTHNATTPGLAIGVATPHLMSIGSHNVVSTKSLLPATDDRSASDKRSSQYSSGRRSTEKPNDYFPSSEGPNSPSETASSEGALVSNGASQSPTLIEAENGEKSKESRSLFGKKFSMNFPKKLGGRSSTETKHTLVDEKSEESDKSEDKEEQLIQQSLYGTIQKIRYGYETQMQNEPAQPLVSDITTSLNSETPLIHYPPHTTVIIQEERPDSGGVSDLYRGTVSTVGEDARLIEKTAPMWLGDLLLKNQMPHKEIPKVSFILQPYQDSLPGIASSDGNDRLNANRMLRAKKILAYVAERIEVPPPKPTLTSLRPEEYLELYCQNQVIYPSAVLCFSIQIIDRSTAGSAPYYLGYFEGSHLERC